MSVLRIDLTKQNTSEFAETFNLFLLDLFKLKINRISRCEISIILTKIYCNCSEPPALT